jgi:hypothetical protein
MPAVRAHQDNVDNPTRPPMLKSIVEYDEIAAELPGFVDGRESVGSNDDRDIWIERAMHQWFIVAVPAEDNGRLCSSVAETPGKVRC